MRLLTNQMWIPCSSLDLLGEEVKASIHPTSQGNTSWWIWGDCPHHAQGGGGGVKCLCQAVQLQALLLCFCDVKIHLISTLCLLFPTPEFLQFTEFFLIFFFNFFQRLLKLKTDGTELVTNVEVAADAREAMKRLDEEEARRQRYKEIFQLDNVVTYTLNHYGTKLSQGHDFESQ